MIGDLSYTSTLARPGESVIYKFWACGHSAAARAPAARYAQVEPAPAIGLQNSLMVEGLY
jgi:hypothetical protein